MVAYFQDELAEARMGEIDEHFASCEKCIEAARAAHEFAISLESWTPRAHGEAWRRELVRASLEAAAATAAEPVAARLRSWLGRVREAAAGAVEVLSDVSGARLVTTGLSGILRQDAWRFEPVGAVRDLTDEPVREAVAEEAGWRVTLGEKGLLVVAQNWPMSKSFPAILVIDENGEDPPAIVTLRRMPDGSVAGMFPSKTGHFLLVFFDEKLQVPGDVR
jgi:hypothetical protein